MSCGDPHEVDCRSILEEVFLYLDGEIDHARRLVIRAHLDECGPCLRKYGLEQEVKLLLARCCRSDRAPESLRLAVLERLRTLRVEVDTTD